MAHNPRWYYEGMWYGPVLTSYGLSDQPRVMSIQVLLERGYALLMRALSVSWPLQLSA